MGLRTLVSFEADERAFPPDGGPPPGAEVAQFLSNALDQAGLIHDGPREREGWAWDIFADRGATRIECLVGLTGDTPMQWQVHSYPSTSKLRNLLGRGDSGDDEAFIGAWVNAIDAALKADGRFRSIRWYDEQDFERDHGETFAESPTL